MDKPLDLVLAILQPTLLVPLTLLPIINPIGNAPIFMSISHGNDALARHMARQVAFNAWIILMLSMLVGTYVLQMFGISLEIVRLAGGMLVAATGWQAHSVRGALAGSLKRKGHAIISEKVDGERRYRIGAGR